MVDGPRNRPGVLPKPINYLSSYLWGVEQRGIQPARYYFARDQRSYSANLWTTKRTCRHCARSFRAACAICCVRKRSTQQIVIWIGLRDQSKVFLYARGWPHKAALSQRNLFLRLLLTLSCFIIWPHVRWREWACQTSATGDAHSLENEILEASFSLPRPKVGRAAWPPKRGGYRWAKSWKGELWSWDVWTRIWKVPSFFVHFSCYKLRSFD